MKHARDDLTPPTWALLWAMAECRHRPASACSSRAQHRRAVARLRAGLARLLVVNPG